MNISEMGTGKKTGGICLLISKVYLIYKRFLSLAKGLVRKSSFGQNHTSRWLSSPWQVITTLTIRQWFTRFKENLKSYGKEKCLNNDWVMSSFILKDSFDCLYQDVLQRFAMGTKEMQHYRTYNRIVFLSTRYCSLRNFRTKYF